jgi:hypothetical protein
LRALIVLLICWTASRVLATEPWSYVPPIPAASGPVTPGASVSRAIFAIRIATQPADMEESSAHFAGFSARPRQQDNPRPVMESLATFPGFATSTDDRDPVRNMSSAPDPTLGAPIFTGKAHRGNADPDRWSLDTWLFWRDDGSSAAALAKYGQLGGSQAGARLQYDLTPRGRGRLAAYARLTSAIGDPSAPEAGLGIGYQPSRSIPFTLGVERRVSLGAGARNAFAMMAVTGFGPVSTLLGLQSEGYAQTGFVGLRRRDGFIDGKLSVMHPLAGEKLAAGMAVSGGAQPHIGRLDIGPQIQARLSLDNKPSRLTAEWRRRIAGKAGPGSGLAVTLAAGF